jgi:spermidine synthase
MESKKPAEDVRVLIGGLGMGFTVKEACSFPGVTGIDVVEIEPVTVE